MIAITLEITLIIFLLIIFEDFEAIKKIVKVKSKTKTKANIPTAWLVRLLPISETDTITEVIPAGPAIKGVAQGNTLTLSELYSRSSSFLRCLLSNNISIEIKNKIIPPAIVNAGKDIFR